MELKIDPSKPYGLVLEGGGAKGAYQIGAWKALREAGIVVRGVAGASVGALNGAMICMNDLEKAEYLWRNISYSKVMNVEDDLMDDIIKGRRKGLQIKRVLNEGMKILKDGGIDVSPLRRLIEETVDEEKIRKSPCELYVVTYSLTDRKKLYVNLKEVGPHMIQDMLLASAYFMAFKTEPLHGKKYTDGGGVNNVPLDILVERGYEDIIVVRIYGLGRDNERKVEIPAGTNVYHIAPRQDLGGILEFDRKKCRRNMELGYYDAKRLLYGLEGRYYYLDVPQQEAAYAKRLFAHNEILELWVEQEGLVQNPNAPEGMRYDTEYLFPEIAKILKLRDNWTYKDLYLGMLEELARYYRIPRFRVYTLKSLKQAILHAEREGKLREKKEKTKAVKACRDKRAERV